MAEGDIGGVSSKEIHSHISGSSQEGKRDLL